MSDKKSRTCSFTRIKGFPGMIYKPCNDHNGKKHPCKDCFSCQWCGDTRCAACFNRKKKAQLH